MTHDTHLTLRFAYLFSDGHQNEFKLLTCCYKTGSLIAQVFQSGCNVYLTSTFIHAAQNQIQQNVCTWNRFDWAFSICIASFRLLLFKWQLTIENYQFFQHHHCHGQQLGTTGRGMIYWPCVGNQEEVLLKLVYHFVARTRSGIAWRFVFRRCANFSDRMIEPDNRRTKCARSLNELRRCDTPHCPLRANSERMHFRCFLAGDIAQQ